jgi:hypothetical protein
MPRIEGVWFAHVVPFFAIAPGIACSKGVCTKRDGSAFRGGPRGVYTISMAGLDAQQLADEILLTTDPALRLHDAPFRKGMLAFGTLTSIAYVAADWIGVEPASGDLTGASRGAGANRHVVNALTLCVAVLDLARYAFTDATWLAWPSRFVKVSLAGLVVTL